MPVAGRSTGCFALTDNAANTMQPSSSVWYSSIFLSIHIILFSSRRLEFSPFTPGGSFARYKRLNFYELPPDGFWFSGLFYLILNFILPSFRLSSGQPCGLIRSADKDIIILFTIANFIFRKLKIICIFSL